MQHLQTFLNAARLYAMSSAFRAPLARWSVTRDVGISGNHTTGAQVPILLYLTLAAGLILLVAGGEGLVRGAVALAGRLGVSPLLIGLTVVGFGTSTPELVTSLQAAFADAPGIAVGNVVGSNIANILLILGVSAILAPVIVSRRAFQRDGGAMIAATVVVTGIVMTGALGRVGGAILLAGLVAYIWTAYRLDRAAPSPESAEIAAGDMALWKAALYALGGIALTVLGARFLVMSATELAGRLGVSDAVIGLTVVAVGTSLPELVTSVMAAIRKQGDIAFGNVLGSNIYNIAGILGITALVHPLEVPSEIAAFDIWVMCGATALLAVVATTAWRISRAEGGFLLLLYAAYIGWLAYGAL
ncbi:Inner membrane protein YrbG [Palleronia abyssalis]|uniref:Inner membrane protein YrbG n=1 Tax=Palleronia abyssalis TaxID=1501240 RepID=A0A2R8C1D3_9RHOB|nr:Inner membrane protein YrbG [Palleronia abyssalis]